MLEAPPALQARQLLRAARAGTLATVHAGQPFAALVTPATAPDLSLLLWLSTLSEHTRHLQADPRCALHVAGPPDGPNPQTAPRVTITGLAQPDPNPELKARWLAVHPYAAQYADFADFALWRIRPTQALYVAGFARAHRLRQVDLLPDPEAVARIAEAAQSIMTHCNTDHPDTIALLAGAPGPWRMVAVDVDGCDLARADTVRRIAWSEPLPDAHAVRGELIRLARAQ